MKKCVDIKSRYEKYAELGLEYVCPESVSEPYISQSPYKPYEPYETFISYLYATEADVHAITSKAFKFFYTTYVYVYGGKQALPSIIWNDLTPDFVPASSTTEVIAELADDAAHTLKQFEQTYGKIKAKEQLDSYKYSTYQDSIYKPFTNLLFDTYKLTNVMSLGELTIEFENYWQHQCFRDQVKHAYLQHLVTKYKISCSDVVNHAAEQSDLALYSLKSIVNLASSGLTVEGLDTSYLVNMSTKLFEDSLKVKHFAEKVCESVFGDIATIFDENNKERMIENAVFGSLHDNGFRVDLLELDEAVRNKNSELAIQLYNDKKASLAEHGITALMKMAVIHKVIDLAAHVFADNKDLFKGESAVTVIKMLGNEHAWDLATQIFNTNSFSAAQLVVIFEHATKRAGGWDFAKAVYEHGKSQFSQDDMVYLVDAQFRQIKELADGNLDVNTLTTRIINDSFENKVFTKEYVFNQMVKLAMDYDAWKLAQVIFYNLYSDYTKVENVVENLNSDVGKLIASVNKKGSGHDFIFNIFTNFAGDLTKSNSLAIMDMMVEIKHWNKVEDIVTKKLPIFIEDIALTEKTVLTLTTMKAYNLISNILPRILGNAEFQNEFETELCPLVIKFMEQAIHNNNANWGSGGIEKVLLAEMSYIKDTISVEQTLSLITKAQEKKLSEFASSAFEQVYPQLDGSHAAYILDMLTKTAQQQSWNFTNKILALHKDVFTASNISDYYEFLKLVSQQKNPTLASYLYETYKELLLSSEKANQEVTSAIKFLFEKGIDDLAIRIYEEQKSLFTGKNIASIINSFISKSQPNNHFAVLIQDAYKYGMDNGKLTNGNIVSIIKSLLGSHYKHANEDLFDLGKQILADNQAHFSADDFTAIITNALRIQYGWVDSSKELLAFGLELFKAKKDILSQEHVAKILGTSLTSVLDQKIINEMTEGRVLSASFMKDVFKQINSELKDHHMNKVHSNLYEYLLSIPDYQFDKLEASELPEGFSKHINAIIPGLARESNIEALEHLTKIFDTKAFLVNDQKFFFQSTKDACFGTKSNLDLIDLKALSFPLEIGQIFCDTKIKLEGNKLLVVHGHKASDVYEYIMHKTGAGQDASAPSATFTTFVGAGHGFIKLANQTSSDAVPQGFYPGGSDAVGFDYTSNAFLWGAAIITVNLASTVLSGVAKGLLIASIAHPVIMTSAVAVLSLAAFYDLKISEESYIKQNFEDMKKYLGEISYQNVFDNTVGKLFTFYDNVNQVTGATVGTSLILTSATALSWKVTEYLFGAPLVAANLIYHVSSAATSACKNSEMFVCVADRKVDKFVASLIPDIKLHNYLPASIISAYEILKTALSAPSSYIYENLLGFSDRLTVVKGVVNDEDFHVELGNEKNFPLVSFLITEEQKGIATQYIKDVRANCQAKNEDVDICAYQMLSTNCFQFVQSVKEAMGMDEISYYAYLNAEQRAGLFVDNIPMLDSSWKSSRTSAVEVELPSELISEPLKEEI